MVTRENGTRLPEEGDSEAVVRFEDIRQKQEEAASGGTSAEDAHIAEALTAAEKTVESGKRRVEEDAEDARANIVEKLGEAKEGAPREEDAASSEEGSPKEDTPAEPTSTKENKWTNAILIIVVAVVLLAIFLLITGQHRKSGSKAESAADEEAAAPMEDIPIVMDLEWDSADDMPTIMTEATDPIGRAILQHAELGHGIGAIMQVPTLTIPEETNVAGASEAGEFEDSVWYEEGGNKKTYADALIACIITYYRELYKAEDGKHLDVLEIGEIRQSGEDLFVATRIHEHTEPHEEEGEVTIVTDMLCIRMADKQAVVEERESVIAEPFEGEED